MTTDHLPEPVKVKWWKLAVRPRADQFTAAIQLLILATLAGIGWLRLPFGWREPLVSLAVVVAAWRLWRGWRMPPDPPIQIVA